MSVVHTEIIGYFLDFARILCKDGVYLKGGFTALFTESHPEFLSHKFLKELTFLLAGV